MPEQRLTTMGDCSSSAQRRESAARRRFWRSAMHTSTRCSPTRSVPDRCTYTSQAAIPRSARSFASATATSSLRQAGLGPLPGADLELPRHRHAAERPRLNAGAGRRGALGGDAPRRLQEDLSRPQRLTPSSWERFAAGACLKDAATLAGSPVAGQRARVTRSRTRAANGMCGERQTCRSSNGHA
jgi:hypothetical protein